MQTLKPGMANTSYAIKQYYDIQGLWRYLVLPHNVDIILIALSYLKGKVQHDYFKVYK